MIILRVNYGIMSRFKHFPCAVHGLIFVASVGDNSSINVGVYRMSQTSREIVDHDSESLHLQLKPDCETQIVHFKTCVEPDTGLILPVLVLLIKSNTATVKIRSAGGVKASRLYIFGIKYDEHKKEILPLRYFHVNGQLCEEIKLLNNLIITWIQNGLIHIAVPSPHNKTLLCKHAFQISKHLKNVTNEELIWTGKPQGICQGCYLALCRVTKHDTPSDGDIFLENHVSVQFLLILLTEKTDGQWCNQELCVSDIIPEMYSANLLTLSVITCKLKHSVASAICANKSSAINQTSIDSHVIALIENGYLLELKCGQIQRCFQLDNPCFQSHFSFEIAGLFGTNSIEQFAVINVQTSDGTECLAVDLQKRKVSHHWTSTGYILTGDFIRLGTQQLLVLFSDWSFQSCSGSWLLTDFGTTQIDTREATDASSTSTDTDSSSSVHAVVKALASCLQKSKISLQEDENDLLVKKDFVESMWSRLQQRSTGGGSSGSPNLMVPMVTLVDGCQKSSKSETSPLSSRIQIELKQVWQFVIGEKWVVGVTVVNNSKRPISDCVLSLVSKSSGSTRYVSQSRWPVTSGDKSTAPTVVKSFHSMAKRLKLDVNALPLTSRDKKIIQRSKSATVACCTAMPVISFEKEIPFSVILHCVEVQEPCTPGSGDGDVISVCCGEVAINVHDYTDGRYSIDLKKDTVAEKWDSVREAMDCAQLSVLLKVCSTFSLLGNMKSLLTQQAGFIFHKELQSYICCDREVLNLLRIQVHTVKSSKEVIIQVSTRDESQILLLVQYLYSHFPDDITILPSNEHRTQNVVQNSLSCITEEIQYAMSGARDLLSVDDDIHPEANDVTESTSVDTISKIQDRFKEQQNKFENQSKGYVAKEKYNEFCKQLLVHELKTDESFTYVDNL
ncbi:uncharacterized protein LOC121374267 isoform X2 [Gigantopelta aegis]|uniref:uncharacterized protein LOC121374267 isoform X2 n=1 Tax=Gigantopelta aegis TaxID=1735272 RepID=UPI001B887FFC|nr:uncharacterized protein LOC121374267 isoform X2 [Gigantopelta aegis]